jgi:Holliday junction DNA helicase RuvA
MIGRLEGILIENDGHQVIVDCGGVGYLVTCSGYTLNALPPVREAVVLRIFTHALENKIALYGFFTPAERQLFDALITVKNVGPSSAMAILSGGADPRAIAELIAREDTAGLTRIKGVGKKTAELLVVELHEKCTEMLLTWNLSGEVRPSARPAGSGRAFRPRVLDEVSSALVAMGWKPAEAEAVVGDLELTPGMSIEELLRQALRSMPR